MSAPQDESAVPEVRFKRRKIAHKKRAPTQDEAVTALVSKSPEAESIDNAPTLLNHDEDDAESVANLQKIIRNRRRPRDRFKESARKPEPRSTEIVPVEVPRADQYTSRFVAQTGQIVDRDDKQMYVRMLPFSNSIYVKYIVPCCLFRYAEANLPGRNM